MKEAVQTGQPHFSTVFSFKIGISFGMNQPPLSTLQDPGHSALPGSSFYFHKVYLVRLKIR